MNYEKQTELVKRTIKRFPKFKKSLSNYVRNFNRETNLSFTEIRIGGVLISDAVLLNLHKEINSNK